MEVLVGLLVLMIMVSIFIYNSIKGKFNEIEKAVGGMNTYLKQRYDLIPNIVESVKQYMQHERQTLEEITKLRTEALNQGKGEDVAAVNNKITKALEGILVSVENYPDLKSNTNFIQLQKNLKNVEDNIAASRRFYNAAVTDFNNSLDMFPSNLFASSMGMQRREVFEINEFEKGNVDLEGLF
jgi:LemA protein